VPGGALFFSVEKQLKEHGNLPTLAVIVAELPDQAVVAKQKEKRVNEAVVKLIHIRAERALRLVLPVFWLIRMIFYRSTQTSNIASP